MNSMTIQQIEAAHPLSPEQREKNLEFLAWVASVVPTIAGNANKRKSATLP